MKLTKIRLALVVIGLLASSCALAQVKYIWIDEHGVKQFSDTPPPGNIPEKNILKQPHRIAPQSTASPADDVGTVSDTKSAPSLADREADFNKRRAEQAKLDEKAAADAAKAHAKTENCAHAKLYLDSLNSGMRMKTVGKDGQPAFLDDSQRAGETQQAQQAVNDNCSSG